MTNTNRSKITIKNGMLHQTLVPFTELRHGDVFILAPESHSRAGMTGNNNPIPMMKFEDGFDGSCAICLDDGDWFHFRDAQHFLCLPVNLTITITDYA